MLDKLSFLKILKEICNILDDLKVRYEIPYVYKNKQEYDHIKIIISNDLNIDLLVNKLGSNYQNFKDYIDYYYKNFRIIFIKADDDNFISSFLYYSWDILPTLMNVILNKMGLNLTPQGLKYIAIENPFIVTKNMKLIIEFLDLNYDIYIKKGFNNLVNEYIYILSSPYSNLKLFNQFKLDQNDYFFFDKNKQYLEFLDFIKDLSSEHDYDFNDDLNSYVLNIDIMFPNCDFLKKLLKMNNMK